MSSSAELCGWSRSGSAVVLLAQGPGRSDLYVRWPSLCLIRRCLSSRATAANCCSKHLTPPAYPAALAGPILPPFFARSFMSDSAGICSCAGADANPALFPSPRSIGMLDEHEIGMGHEILYQDEWITLEEFFAALRKAAAPAGADGRNRPSQPSPSRPSDDSRQREKSSPARIKVSVTPAAEGRRPRRVPPRNRLALRVSGRVRRILWARITFMRDNG